MELRHHLTIEQCERLRSFSRQVGRAAAAGDLDAAWGNRALRDLARDDMSLSCLAWRQITNAARLAAYGDHDDVLWALTSGDVVASAFSPEKIVLTTVDDGILVVASSVMTTGVHLASHILLDGTLDGERATCIVPASLISHIVRPVMAGLDAADNALVSIEGVVPASCLLGPDEAASMVVSLPYRLGLTMGAIALGGADRIMAMLSDDKAGEDDVTGFATIVAAHAAVEALVNSAPADATAWRSHAAKLAATTMALDVAQYARTRFGARAYAASHPLNQLERDLMGIAYQAPTNPNAARRVVAAVTS
jgi:alkylation response protein AidB-like acyl-CoA dehydrogenase